MQADVALSVPANFFSMSSRRHRTGVKSMVETVMWWMAGAGNSLINRTLFFAFVSPIVAANMRAFSVVCRKSILTVSHRTPNDTPVTALRVDVLRFGRRLVLG